VSDSGKDMRKKDLEQLLNILNEEIERLGVGAEFLLCGGAVFVLEGFREMSRDFDGLLRPRDIVEYIRTAVAKRAKIKVDWLDTDVNRVFDLAYVPRTEYVLVKQYRNFRVFRVSDDLLLAMKVYSAREKRDLKDTIDLLRRLKITDYNVALSWLDDIRKRTSSKARRGTRYLFTLGDKEKNFLRKAIESL